MKNFALIKMLYAQRKNTAIQFSSVKINYYLFIFLFNVLKRKCSHLFSNCHISRMKQKQQTFPECRALFFIDAVLRKIHDGSEIHLITGRVDF